ncbi:hypothetical protein [Agreia sp. COWG]|uniref:hypothetical protein n=1 Tax=Agreia sp. COWG TaxID=2773266 RepID=UPI001AF4AF3F|nr:hypothetical protein [Agreia sp. COWG]CAD5999229.1 conserved protein of unknown function [Agreia sp. COWG]
MTTAKAVKTAPEPGPKPDYLVVEDHLKCQTNEGEISIDLRIPLKRIELFMEMDGNVEQQHMPRYIIDKILWPEDAEQLDNMRDGAKALTIVMKVSEQLGQRMGAEMGESKPSTPSSESTDGPSATTSDTASE